MAVSVNLLIALASAYGIICESFDGYKLLTTTCGIISSDWLIDPLFVKSKKGVRYLFHFLKKELLFQMKKQ